VISVTELLATPGSVVALGQSMVPGSGADDEAGGGAGGTAGQSMMPAKVLAASMSVKTTPMLSVFSFFMVVLLKGKVYWFNGTAKIDPEG
jgi:hypothetical protein